MKLFGSSYSKSIMLSAAIIMPTSQITAANTDKAPKYEFEEHTITAKTNLSQDIIGKILKTTQAMGGYYTSLKNSELTVTVPLQKSESLLQALNSLLKSTEHSFKRTDKTAEVNRWINTYKSAKDSLKTHYDYLAKTTNFDRAIAEQANIENQIRVSEAAESQIRGLHQKVNKAFFTVNLAVPQSELSKKSGEDNISFEWMSKLNIDHLLEFSAVFEPQNIVDDNIIVIPEIDTEPADELPMGQE